MKNIKFWVAWFMVMIMLYAGFFLLGAWTAVTMLQKGVSFETPRLEYNLDWEGHNYGLTGK